MHKEKLQHTNETRSKTTPPITKSFNPDQYLLDEGLVNAVDVAYTLGQPLLLTGEPGTGKTKLAFKIADVLSKKMPERFIGNPFVFNTKTTSSARDLFYTYDALAHFQAANLKQASQAASTAQFIELQALGRAIAQTNPTPEAQQKFKTKLETKPMSSVVLIDEIDKAPAIFPMIS